ncbi:hypothetical protein [Spirochaeta africana]|uniref:Uncharacterized protein n=1 Tax=Spirochaeta africana (strain ATCC 700263 / DSM 8902 / Z-7692) TaxID=889378 RepID=H9UFV6_SPIAZ|nr:hypothetical protein [Spirochaeta africana]AFG36399.1 hypothetical protein Spiaf_0291 [Spirochaeta africana DSM 8902]
MLPVYRFVIFLLLAIPGMLLADPRYDYDRTFEPPQLPGPSQEFAVTGYDAVQAVWMLRRTTLIQQVDPPDSQSPGPLPRRTVAVRQARVVKVAPQLYTIYLNGEPLDWDHSYIRYNGRMTNLRLLFSYRNQPHPFDLPLYLD